MNDKQKKVAKKSAASPQQRATEAQCMAHSSLMEIKLTPALRVLITKEAERLGLRNPLTPSHR